MGALSKAFLGVVCFAVLVNFVIFPMFNDIRTSVTNNTALTVGQAQATNSTGNVTAQYNVTEIGLFGNPESQLNAVLLILGVSGGIAAIAVFGTGAQPGPAAVVAFIVALVLIIVNVLIAGSDLIQSVPFIGTPGFILIVAFVMLGALLTAAKIMSGSGGDE